MMNKDIVAYRIEQKNVECWVVGLDSQGKIIESLGMFYSKEMAHLFLDALPVGCDEPILNRLDRAFTGDPTYELEGILLEIGEVEVAVRRLRDVATKAQTKMNKEKDTFDFAEPTEPDVLVEVVDALLDIATQADWQETDSNDKLQGRLLNIMHWSKQALYLITGEML